MSKITPQERLDLKKMLRESDAVDNTEHIRKVKHSIKIHNDITKLEHIKKICSPDLLESSAKENAPFLYENYPDIFKKVLNNELDLEIMTRLLTVLKLIENGNVDQHEASVVFGKILKELYLDSTLRKCKKLDEEQAEKDLESPPTYAEEKQISWTQWRNKRTEIKQKLEEANKNNV